MLIRIVFCTKCDDMKLPKELIRGKGTDGCRVCKKNTCKIALFDTDSDVKSLLQEA